KQLFDLGCLLAEVTDLDIAYQSFQKIANKELVYRDLVDTTVADVLDDTIEVALLLAKRERNKTEPNHSRFQALNMGVRRFQSFLMDGRFNIEQAIETAAKIAFLAACFKQQQPASYKNLVAADTLIDNPKFNFLNRYLKIKNATYLYWFNTLKIIADD
ncbi:MAG: hypothetical protein AB8G86_09345, partial [Saprospiraceae bacterium]